MFVESISCLIVDKIEQMIYQNVQEGLLHAINLKNMA